MFVSTPLPEHPSLPPAALRFAFDDSIISNSNYSHTAYDSSDDSTPSDTDEGKAASVTWNTQVKQAWRGAAYERITVPDKRARMHRASSLSEKIRREQSLSARVMRFRLPTLDILMALVVIFFTFHYVIFPASEVDVEGMKAKRSTDAFFLDLWTRHVTTHPVQARDRTGFAEMGLRTQMYAHLLADTSLPDFDDYEKVLWPFIPGIKSLRQSYFEGAKFSKDRPKTRGIVMSLGGNNFDFAIQFLSTLRYHWRSEMPVELHYWGDHDLPADMRHYLTTKFSHVSTVDLEKLGFFDESLTQLNRQGYALKPFALVATNLTEVILADADAVLLAHPDEFFEQPGFAETGTLFFHDRDHVRKGAAEIIHDFMGAQLELRGPSERLKSSLFWQRKGIYEMESGVVVVDKSRMEVFSALLFAAWQNTGEVREKTTYRVFWGDKETFWLAFELANFPYNFVQHYAGAIGNEHASHEEGFCSEHPFHVFDAPASHSKLKLRDLALPEEASIDGSAIAAAATKDITQREAAVEARSSKSTRAKPAWFNGSLLDLKKVSADIYFQPTSFATEGGWEFLEKSEMWCMRNYTAHPITDFDLGNSINAIIDLAKSSLAEARLAIPAQAPK